MTRQLHLFTSKECCLCDQALSIIEAWDVNKYFNVQKIDIYRDKVFLVRYKLSIPVLKDVLSGGELYWPFDTQQLAAWVESLDP